MKKLTFLFIICLVSILTKAEVIHEETFNYQVSTLEEIPDWVITGTITKGNGRILDNSPLTYEVDGKIYALSGTGKKVINDFESGSDYIAYKPIPTVNSGSVYFSFLYKATETQGQQNSEIIGLSDRTTNSALKPWAGKTEAGSSNPFRLGITRSSTSSSQIQWGEYELEVGKVYLVIAKYDFDTQTASLYINPDLGSTVEPQPVIQDDSQNNARTQLNFLMFKHNGSSKAKFEVSGIRISTTWQEAVAEKLDLLPLATPSVNDATHVTTESFTASWNNIDQATGYEINLYKEGILQQTYSCDTETSKTLHEIIPGNTYTYTVTAKGDGLNYKNSEESNHSTPIIIAPAPFYITTNFNDETWGEIATALPPETEYPTDYYYNDFYFSNAILLTGASDCEEGERHINRITLNKNSYNGYVNTPFVSSPEEIELHVSSGSDNRQFIVKQSLDGINWNTIGTYTNTNKGEEYIHKIAVENADIAKFRIENATGSSLYIYQIIVTSNSNLSSPVAIAANGIASTEFIANWEKVTTATGYKIYLYQSEELINTYTISDQNVTQQLLEELQKDIEYKYHITALNGEIESVPSNPITVTTNSAIWSRDFYTDGGWETICLPYNVIQFTDANNNAITGYSLKEFTGATSTQDEARIIFNNATSLEAGKPYILSMPAATTTQTKAYIHLDKTTSEIPAPLSVTYEDYSFTGTYEGIPAGEAENKFVLNGDGTAFVRGISTTEVREYGAYFTLPSGTDKRRLIIQFGDGPTNISDNSTDELNIYTVDKTIIINTPVAQKISIYSIDGRIVKVVGLSQGENQIENLAEGLYIINTTKVILK